MRIVLRLPKEAPMRKKRETQTVEQLDLFLPPPRRPTWAQLPGMAKQKLTELLAELLREKHRQKASLANAKEVIDE
jgi:hypothetical protein